LTIYNGIGACNVSFPNKGIWLAGSVAIFTGIIVYANRTYLNQPEGIKNNGVWHKDFTSKGKAWMTGIVLTLLYCFVLVSKIFRLNQDGGVILES
jgi:hypothetical protein